jgi:sodium/potassium-transporting ATPase subunit alpha
MPMPLYRTHSFIDIALAIFHVVLTIIISFHSYRAAASYFGERSTSRFNKIFKKMLPSSASVIRDGAMLIIPSTDLVVGDVVRVVAGEKVPADIRIFASRDMQVEASAITGESEPIVVIPDVCDASIDSLHAPNIIFNGSACLQGEGTGIVVQTGDRSLIGRIANLAGNQQMDQTPMQKDVARFIRILAIFSVVLAAIFFIIGVAQNSKNALNIFINSFILVTIANVPQGLPGTVTSLLTITGRKMARRNVYVKRLDSVETLGSCSVIATDKTGTLTENKMTVENLWFDLETVPLEKVVRAPKSFFSSQSFSNLFRVAALCSRVVVQHVDDLDASSIEEEPAVRTSFSTSRRSMELAAGDKIWSGNSTMPESFVRCAFF